MKRHVQNSGTKKWFGDYFCELESEPLKAVDNWASAYGGCIIAGASLSLVSGTTYNIAAAMVVLKIDSEYKVAPMPATTDIDVSVQKAIRLKKTAVTGQYQNPVDLTIAYNYSAEIIDYTAGLGTLNEDYLLIPTNGGAIRSYADVIKDALAVATTASKGLFSAADKTKLDGIAVNANNYTHPISHPASMISEDASHRFTSDSQQLNFWDGDGSTKLYATGKNVGIGTETPSANIHILDNTEAILKVQKDVTTYLQGGTTIGIVGTYSDHPFRIRVNQSDLMHFGTDGNIGIGTTAPDSKLHVKDGNIKISHENSTPSLQFKDDSDDDNFTFFYNRSSDRFYLSSNTTTIINFLKDGKVGIGTTSPSAKLHVDGQIKANGFRVTGSLQGTYTNNAVFDAIKGAIPNTGDEIIVSGAIGVYFASKAKRISSTQISFYCTYLISFNDIMTDTFTVTDGNSSSNKVNLAW